MMSFPKSRWQPWEVFLAVAVAALIFGVLASRVDYSGSWDGDPALRNRLAMETVNYFVSAWNGGGNPFLAFVQTFHRFPTIAHESMLAIFILFANGLERVDFDTVAAYGAWFSTAWTLVGALVLYRVLRHFSPRHLALLALPICVLTGYILLYANFPRQNMPSHVLGWIAFAIYLHARSKSQAIPTWQALAVGALFGLSVPTHYSSTYLAFVFLAAEPALALVQRAGAWVPAWNLFRMFSAALAVWLAIDAYFYVATWAHPEIVSFDGGAPRARNHGFFSGMLHAGSRLATEAAAYKLEDQVWWFLPGFLYRNFGMIGTMLIFLGLADLARRIRGNFREFGNPKERGEFIAMIAVLVSLIVSLGYFQNARKLMVFYPAWCICLAYGFNLVVNGWRRTPREDADPIALRGAFVPSIGIAFAILLLQALLYFPEARAVYEARRDFGYMKKYLENHAIRDLLVYTRPADSPEDIMTIAPNQKVLDGLPAEEADKYQFVMVYRLYRGTDSAVMDKLRGITPVFSVKNQNALPLAWYEFPLKKGFADFDDPLTYTRSLYRWPEVRQVFFPPSTPGAGGFD